LAEVESLCHNYKGKDRRKACGEDWFAWLNLRVDLQSYGHFTELCAFLFFCCVLLSPDSVSARMMAGAERVKDSENNNFSSAKTKTSDLQRSGREKWGWFYAVTLFLGLLPQCLISRPSVYDFTMFIYTVLLVVFLRLGSMAFYEPAQQEAGDFCSGKSKTVQGRLKLERILQAAALFSFLLLICQQLYQSPWAPCPVSAAVDRDKHRNRRSTA
ncbi:unnamed protein product, partial [Amoebophrya sp. A120]